MISGVRSLTMTILLAFFLGYGIYFLTKLEIKKVFKYFIYLSLLIGLIFNLGYYLDLYHNHMVRKAPKQWLYGYKQAMDYIVDKQQNFDEINMTNFYGQPYIFYLFHTRYQPSQYQAQANLERENSVDVGKVNKIDNINFKSLNWQDTLNQDNELFIFSVDEILRSELNKQPDLMKEFTPIGVINNQAMFYAYEK